MIFVRFSIFLVLEVARVVATPLPNPIPNPFFSFMRGASASASASGSGGAAAAGSGSSSTCHGIIFRVCSPKPADPKPNPPATAPAAPPSLPPPPPPPSTPPPPVDTVSKAAVAAPVNAQASASSQAVANINPSPASAPAPSLPPTPPSSLSPPVLPVAPISSVTAASFIPSPSTKTIEQPFSTIIITHSSASSANEETTTFPSTTTTEETISSSSLTLASLDDAVTLSSSATVDVSTSSSAATTTSASLPTSSLVPPSSASSANQEEGSEPAQPLSPASQQSPSYLVPLALALIFCVLVGAYLFVQLLRRKRIAKQFEDKEETFDDLVFEASTTNTSKEPHLKSPEDAYNYAEKNNSSSNLWLPNQFKGHPLRFSTARSSISYIGQDGTIPPPVLLRETAPCISFMVQDPQSANTFFTDDSSCYYDHGDPLLVRLSNLVNNRM